MISNTQKQEEKEIKRLKKILFPKNKPSSQHSSSEAPSSEFFDKQTETTLLQPINNRSTNKDQQSKKSKQKQSKISKPNLTNQVQKSRQSKEKIDQKNKNKHKKQQNIESDERPQIKEEIEKLRRQITNMLEKWHDYQKDQDEDDYSVSPQRQEKKLNQYKISKQWQQEITNQHYLKSINEISKNLQKYNAHMYGIRQASEELLQILPVRNDDLFIKNDSVKSYRLFYLASLLTNFFVAQIDAIRKNNLQYGFRKIWSKSEINFQVQVKQRQKILINKSDFLFIRRNLLDKAFKKWRLNSSLLNFKDSLSQEYNYSEVQISNFSCIENSRSYPCRNQDQREDLCNKKLKRSQFILKNILQRQKIVDYLQKYLKNSLKASEAEQNIKRQKQNMFLNQEFEIVLLDQQSNQLFSFVNCNSSFSNMQNNIVESRLQNVLESVIDYGNQTERKTNSVAQNQKYKKYSFPLKNSLTRMSIDSQKIMRIPEMKKNQVYSLEVDGSINHQIWIRTSKTHRRKYPYENQDKQALKKVILAYEVFYEEQSFTEQHSYQYQNPSIRTSAIFYPIIHQSSLIGLIRHYVYHSRSINLPIFEIPYEDLQFVAESLFMSFEMSYSFANLRRQNSIISQKYTIKVLRMMKKIQEQKKTLQNTQNQQNQQNILQKMMSLFSNEISFLFYDKNNGKTLKSEILSDQVQALIAFQMKTQSRRNFYNNAASKLYFYSQQAESQRFHPIYRSNKYDFTSIEPLFEQFFQNSSNKDSNIQIIKHSSQNHNQVIENKLFKHQSSKFLIFIKPSNMTQIDQIYFIIVLNSNSHCSEVYQKNEFLPPLQLIFAVSNRFTHLLEDCLRQYKINCENSRIRAEISLKNNKNEFKSRLKDFYLDSIKDFINREQRSMFDFLSNNQGSSNFYITQVNEFISKIINYAARELKNLQIITCDKVLKDLGSFKVEYIVEINLPFQKSAIQNIKYDQISVRSQKIYFLIQLSIFPKTQNDSLINDFSHEKIPLGNQIKGNILSQEQYSMLSKQTNQLKNQSQIAQNIKRLVFQKLPFDQPFSPVATNTFFQFPKFLLKRIQLLQAQQQQIPEVKSSIKQTDSTKSFQSKTSKQEIEQLLRSIIQNYLILTQNSLAKSLLKKVSKIHEITQKICKNLLQKSNAINRSESLTIWIKNKVFKTFGCDNFQNQKLRSVERIDQFSQREKYNIQKNSKTNVDTLKVIGIVKQVLEKLICSEFNYEQSDLTFEVNQIKFEQLLGQLTKAKNTEKFNSFYNLHCNYHHFVSNQFLSIHQFFLGAAQCSSNQPKQFVLNHKEKQQLQYEDFLITKLIAKSSSFLNYSQRLLKQKVIPQDKQKDQTPNKILIKFLNSSYLTISISQTRSTSSSSLLSIKIKNTKSSGKLKSHIHTDPNRIIFLKQTVQNAIKTILRKYPEIYIYEQNLHKMNNIVKAVSLLAVQPDPFIQTQTVFFKQRISKISAQGNLQKINNFQLYKKIGIIMPRLKQSWIKVFQFSKSQYLKGKKLIWISQIVPKSKNKLILNYLVKWSIITKQINQKQKEMILRTKVVENLHQQTQKIFQVIGKIGRICVYSKHLKISFNKIRSYSKYNRLAEFKDYRNKFLHKFMQKLTTLLQRNQSVGMKLFFNYAFEILVCKRRQQLRKQKSTNLFETMINNSSFFRKKILYFVKNAFIQLKRTNFKQKLESEKNHSINQKTTSLDQKITQSNSIHSIKQILIQQFPQYDIWIRQNTKSDHYTILFISTFYSKTSQDNHSIKNPLKQQFFQISSKLNQNLTAINQKNQKLSKEQLFAIYPAETYNILETIQAIFIYRANISSIQSEPSLISQTCSNPLGNSLPFRQKQRLHSLERCLSQFLSHYKTQVSIKLSYLDTIYQNLKRKRYSSALKQWKKFNQNHILLATYQITDNLYEFNIQIQNFKERIKIQQKQINDNKNQYNRLLKKESEQKNKIQKYSINIEVLNKMLEDYQKMQKRQDQIIKSASKSSRKAAKNYQGPIVNIFALDQEERSIILLSLTRWRQINTDFKLKELKNSNLSKKFKILSRCVEKSSKIVYQRQLVDGFIQIVSFSANVKQKQQQQQQKQKQREIQLELQNIKAQRQKLRKQSQIKLKQITEKKQKQEFQTENQQKINLQTQKSTTKQLSRKKVQKVQIQKMQRLFQNDQSIDRDPKNQTYQTELFSINDKTTSLGQKTINSNNQDNTQFGYYVQQQNFDFYDSNRYKTANQSLANQLEESFTQLNRRLVTFQKNNASPSSDQRGFITEAYFNSYENSELDRQMTSKDNDIKVFTKYEAPNNSIELMNETGKMTQEEKIRFQLEKMKMKKPNFNKENLTVTREEYQRLNGGSAYKLGGKTLRFLKRMGKLKTLEGNGV